MKSVYINIIKILPILVFLIIPIFHKSLAQDNTYETDKEKLRGTVVEIVQQGDQEYGDKYQKLKIRLNNGSFMEIINNPLIFTKEIQYKTGDRVIIERISTGDGQTHIITDYQRTGYLLFLFIIFVSISIIVGNKYGIYSLISMIFSFFVVVKFILPRIINGANPVITTIVASIFIIPITFYLSHGFNKKTHTAIISTFIALFITILLTSLSINLAHLTGYSSEEAMFLQVANKNINMKGILLAGIIIGFLGVLDDVTVSQASVVVQLKKSKKDYDTISLYKDAMTVGRDHITSMINTLILVYTGASMPLMLIFIDNPHPITDIINMEIIADEIIRTLVGSIGLILAVPISTIISAIIADDGQ